MRDAEYLAMMFHTYYEELAPRFGYKTREESAVPWSQVPEKNKKLMIAVAKKLLKSHVRLLSNIEED